MPLLCWAEPDWTTATRQFERRVARIPGLATAISRHAVPVKLDPLARPDIAARLRVAAVLLGAPPGAVPLLLFLTEDGAPMLAHPTMDPNPIGAEDDRPAQPSLGALLDAVASNYAERRAAFREEAARLFEDGAVEQDAAPLAPDPEALLALVEDRAAGLGDALDRLLHGGVRDQLDGGFHRAAREPRWIVPHFEKPIALSAALALALRRAAAVLARPDLDTMAEDAAAFALDQGRDAEGRLVGAIAADAAYYTWTPQELRRAVPLTHQQAIGFHFAITSARTAHVLYRALTAEGMHRYVHADPAALQRLIVEGRAAMRAARTARIAPATVSADGVAWRAELLRLRLELAKAGFGAAGTEHDLRELLALARTMRGSRHVVDVAAPLAALVVAARCPALEEASRRVALSVARDLADALLTRHFDPATARLLDLDEDGVPAASVDLVDGLLPAAVPLAMAGLASLARLAGEARLLGEAGRIATAYAALAGRLGSAAARYRRAAALAG
jgi:uncharacterized protein YyaL (SSP411 family)